MGKSENSAARPQGRPDGWWYPFIFVGGFAVVVTVNVIMMYFATTTFSGLAVNNAYERGVAYNSVIAQERAQEALGWTPDFQVTPRDAAGGGTGTGAGTDTRPVSLSLTMIDPQGHPVDGLRVELMLMRPAQPGHDREVRLLPVGPGTYRADVELPMAGQWDAQIFTRRGDDTFRLRERMFVR